MQFASFTKQDTTHAAIQAIRLKQEFPYLKQATIASVLGISQQSVSKYLKGLDTGGCYQQWTKEETAILESSHRTIPSTLIAQRLKRSKQVVREKATRLGLTIRESLNNFSDIGLAKDLGIDTRDIEHWIAAKLLKAKRKKGGGWIIKAQNFAAFVLKHPELVSHLESPILIWLRQEF